MDALACSEKSWIGMHVFLCSVSVEKHVLHSSHEQLTRKNRNTKQLSRKSCDVISYNNIHKMWNLEILKLWQSDIAGIWKCGNPRICKCSNPRMRFFLRYAVVVWAHLHTHRNIHIKTKMHAQTRTHTCRFSLVAGAHLHKHVSMRINLHMHRRINTRKEA